VAFAMLALLGILLFLRSQALERELEAMQQADGDAIDMESPFVKVLGFLQELGQGEHAHVLRPWKKSSMERKARELRSTLMRSNNIAAPDVQAQMAGRYSEDIVRFVLEHTMEGSASANTDSCSSQQRESRISSRSSSADLTQTGGKLQGELSLVGQCFTMDAFHMHFLCPNGLLAMVAIRLCEDWSLGSQLGLSMTRLATFVNIIEKGHQDNPYHCLPHTIDVTMRLGAILNRSGIAAHMSRQGKTGACTLLGALIAAIVHDYKHLGVSNNFLVSTEQELAIRYNHQSCLENHALFEALNLLRQPETSFIYHFSSSKHLQLRSLVIKMVLATDMSQHFSMLTMVQTKILDNFDSSIALEERLASLNTEQCGILLQLCLKCADVGHCTLPTKLHVRWTEALQEELWALGDKEKVLGLNISPLADRDKPGALWGGNQVGFLQALVCPMFNMLVAVAPECRELQDGVNENLAFWKNHPETPPPDMLVGELSSFESFTDSGPSRRVSSGRSLQVGSDGYPPLALAKRATSWGSSERRSKAIHGPPKHRLSRGSDIAGDVELGECSSK